MPIATPEKRSWTKALTRGKRRWPGRKPRYQAGRFRRIQRDGSKSFTGMMFGGSQRARRDVRPAAAWKGRLMRRAGESRKREKQKFHPGAAGTVARSAVRGGPGYLSGRTSKSP